MARVTIQYVTHIEGFGTGMLDYAASQGSAMNRSPKTALRRASSIARRNASGPVLEVVKVAYSDVTRMR